MFPRDEWRNISPSSISGRWRNWTFWRRGANVGRESHFPITLTRHESDNFPYVVFRGKEKSAESCLIWKILTASDKWENGKLGNGTGFKIEKAPSPAWHFLPPSPTSFRLVVSHHLSFEIVLLSSFPTSERELHTNEWTKARNFQPLFQFRPRISEERNRMSERG